MWWRYVLALFVISLPFIVDTICRTREEVKQNRKKGCICTHPYIGLITHNCPVHNPWYLRYYRTVDNKVSCDKIYASYGNQEPICRKCLDKLLPAGYIVNFPVENNMCHTCGTIKSCKLIPERDILLWVDNSG